MIAEAKLAGLRSYRIVLAAIFAAAIAVGWFILPGQNERVAMLERDGHSHEALSILEKLFGSGDRRYNTLLQMQQLYEQEGNIPKARQFLEDMVAERPRDPVLRKRLAHFYRDTHDEGAYLTALRAQIDVRYSEVACRELVAAFRLKGDFSEEQAALQTCRQKGYRRPDDLSRLADLLAASGDSSQAATILRSIDDLRRLSGARERYQLLTLLLESEQPKEAERRCLRWIKSSKDDSFAVGLIEIMARSKYPESAIEVAKDAGVQGDSISLTVAERLVEQSQINPARLYLRGWLEKSQSNDEATLLRFIDAARAASDPVTALAGARKFGLDKLPPVARARLVQDLENAGHGTAAAEVRSAGPLPALPAIEAPVPELNADDEPASVAVLPQQLSPVLVETGPRSGGRTSDRENASRDGSSKDSLEGWRKSLLSKMSDDAARRLQASLYGPPAPQWLNNRNSSLKLFKKTSRILQRAKSNRLLKTRRLQHNETPKVGGKH